MEALLWLAQSQEKAGEADKALASYAKLRQDFPMYRPQCVKALAGRGRVFEQTGKQKDAISEYQTLLQSYPAFQRQADAAKARILALLPTAHLSTADEADVQAAISHYDEVKGSLALAPAEQDLTEKSGAAADYARLRIDRFAAIMKKGQALRDLGRYTEAKSEFQTILKAYSDTPIWKAQAELNFGKTQWKAGELSEAAGAFAQIPFNNASATSECADATLWRGQVFEELGENDNAISQYRKVIADYPDKKSRVSDARYNLACLLKKTGSHTEAAAEFQKVSTDPDTLSWRVIPALEAATDILVSQKKYSEAIAAADTVATMYRPKGWKHVKAMHRKALVQCDARRFSDAAATLRQVIAEPPEDPTALRQAKMLLAQSYLERMENQSGALTLLQGMLTEDGWSRDEKAQITEYIGFCFPQHGSEAEQWFTKTITDYAGAPAADDCYFHRAICRTNRKAFDDALADINLIKVPYLRFYAMGEYYAAQGNKSAAADQYERVYPNLPAGFHGSYFEPYAAYVRLVELYRELGDETKASAASAKMSMLAAERMLPAP